MCYTEERYPVNSKLVKRRGRKVMGLKLRQRNHDRQIADDHILFIMLHSRPGICQADFILRLTNRLIENHFKL